MISAFFTTASTLVLIAALCIERSPSTAPRHRRRIFYQLGSGVLAAAGLVALSQGVLVTLGSPLWLAVLLLQWGMASWAIERSAGEGALPARAAEKPTPAISAMSIYRYMVVATLFTISLSIGVGLSVTARELVVRTHSLVAFAEVVALIDHWLWANLGLVITLLLLAAFWQGRLLFLASSKALASRLAQSARLALLVGLVIPYPLSQRSTLVELYALQRRAWVIAPMRAERGYYLDVQPRSYRELASRRFVLALEGAGADAKSALLGAKTRPRRLLKALRRQPDCLGAQARTLRRGSDLARSARCLTAAQAQLYCRSVGARLPTATEWLQALGSAAPDATRPPREWTMQIVHGSPAFFVVDGAARTTVAGAASLSAPGLSLRSGVRSLARHAPWLRTTMAPHEGEAITRSAVWGLVIRRAAAVPRPEREAALTSPRCHG